MIQSTDYAAWIALFVGLYSLAVALGEWRVPGTWQKMLTELAASPALLIAISFFETGLGAAIYIAVPWNDGNLMGDAMKILGGVMAIEGLLIAGFGDRYIAFLSRMLAPLMRAWLVLVAILGVALVAAAVPRI